MTLTAEGDMEKLKELSARCYKDQACFFLNAFWDTMESESENIWKFCNGMAKLDEKNAENGCELSELHAHKFLEHNEETLTVREMREVLRDIDIDTNKYVSLSEYLIFKYKVDWGVLVNSIQGNKEEVNKALLLLKTAKLALEESQARESDARKAELVARSALSAAERSEQVAKEAETQAHASEAVAHEAESQAHASEQLSRDAATKSKEAEEKAQEAENLVRGAEERVKQATEEVVAAKLLVDAAVDNLITQQKAHERLLNDLEDRGNDENLGLVSRNKAKNELAQAKTEDPLPLQRAKITAEAEQRKHEKLSKNSFIEREKAAVAVTSAKEATGIATAKARTAKIAVDKASKEARLSEVAASKASDEAREAERARESAENKRFESEQATSEAVTARENAESSVAAAHAAFKEAEDYLENAKNTIPNGTLWWIDREIKESKKYLPQSKGGTGQDRYWQK